MTREEVIKDLWDLGFVSPRVKVDVDNLIHKIYDDFENRTCSTCKFDNCGCSVQDSIYRAEQDIVDLSNFGCIKWEDSDES
jgi:hypothetical protein